MPKPEGQNLFSSLLSKKQEAAPTPGLNFMRPSEQPPASVFSAPQENQQEKWLDQLSESTFQSVYLELVRDLSHEYLFKFKNMSSDLADQFVRDGVTEMLWQTVSAEVQLARQERANTVRAQAIDKAANNIFEQMLDDLTSQTCTDLVYNFSELEYWILEEMTCSVFQREFEIILKQIANELNREIRLDRLAESVYFNFGEQFGDKANRTSDLVVEVANFDK